MFFLSDSEWEVMNALWSADELTLPQIRTLLREQGSSWATNTVQTFLTRLAKKGAVEIRRESSPHRYRAVISRQQCESQLFAHLQKQMFQGSATRMLSSFLCRDDISPQELDILREYVETHLKEGG